MIVHVLLSMEHCRGTDFPTHTTVAVYRSARQAQAAYKKLPKNDTDFERTAYILSCPIIEKETSK